MANKVIISCAVTGAIHTPSMSPYLPITPEEIARAFRDAFTVLDRRIGLFLSLPLATLEDMAIKREIDQIGRS